MGRAYQNRKESMAKTSDMKAKVYSKYGRVIYVCAKEGGTDPDGNLALRGLIDKAVTADLQGPGSNAAAAAVVGRFVAERAKAKGIERVAFDRSGFRYHGRVKALADAAREAGLEF